MAHYYLYVACKTSGCKARVWLSFAKTPADAKLRRCNIVTATLLAKDNTKHPSLIDTLSVGVDRVLRNFEPMPIPRPLADAASVVPGLGGATFAAVAINDFC